MELADERVARPRRANAGSRLQELLEQGLGEEEEEVLRAFSDASSDTSFTTDTSEELTDEVESDFSDEEVAGVLEGEIVETEESVWREERRERREAKNKLLARSRHFTEQLANVNKLKEQAKRHKQHKHAESLEEQNNEHKKRRHQDRKEEKEKLEYDKTSVWSAESASSTSDSDSVTSREDNDNDNDITEMQYEHDLRSAFRQRPAPTIPLAERMQAALERAARVREAMRMQSSESELTSSKVTVNDASTSKDVILSKNESKVAAWGQTMHYAHGFNMGKQSMKRKRKNVFVEQQDKFTEKCKPYIESSYKKNTHLGVSENTLLELQNRRVMAYSGTAPSQQVIYRSGRSILSTYGVPTIITFSHDLPPVLKSTNTPNESINNNNNSNVSENTFTL